MTSTSPSGLRTATAQVETPRIITPSSTAWPPIGVLGRHGSAVRHPLCLLRGGRAAARGARSAGARRRRGRRWSRGRPSGDRATPRADAWQRGGQRSTRPPVSTSFCLPCRTGGTGSRSRRAAQGSWSACRSRARTSSGRARGHSRDVSRPSSDSILAGPPSRSAAGVSRRRAASRRPSHGSRRAGSRSPRGGCARRAAATRTGLPGERRRAVGARLAAVRVEARGPRLLGHRRPTLIRTPDAMQRPLAETERELQLRPRCATASGAASRAVSRRSSAARAAREESAWRLCSS